VSATGYILRQSEFIKDLEFVFGEFKTYQVPTHSLEQKTRLTFGTISYFDPLDRIESAGPRLIQGPADLLL
jgi:endonuclease G, mitochondrial